MRVFSHYPLPSIKSITINYCRRRAIPLLPRGLSAGCSAEAMLDGFSAETLPDGCAAGTVLPLGAIAWWLACPRALSLRASAP